MRIRSMKPEYWSSPDVSHMSLATRLVFPGLWSLADDEGRFLADARWIRSQIFPMDEHVGEDSVIIHGGLSEDSVSIHGVLTELSNGGQITLYRAGRDHRLYGQVVNWAHQRINRPTRSRIPPLTSDDEIETDPFSESSVSPHGALTEDSLQEQGNKGTGDRGGVEGMIRRPTSRSSMTQRPLTRSPAPPRRPNAAADSPTAGSPSAPTQTLPPRHPSTPHGSATSSTASATTGLPSPAPKAPSSTGMPPGATGFADPGMSEAPSAEATAPTGTRSWPTPRPTTTRWGSHERPGSYRRPRQGRRLLPRHGVPARRDSRQGRRLRHP